MDIFGTHHFCDAILKIVTFVLSFTRHFRNVSFLLLDSYSSREYFEKIGENAYVKNHTKSERSKLFESENIAQNFLEKPIFLLPWNFAELVNSLDNFSEK